MTTTLQRSLNSPPSTSELDRAVLVVRDLRELADEARIIVTPVAIVSDDPMQDIRRTSRNAALALMGFEALEEGDERAFYDRMQQWTGDLPRVVFVDSIGEMSLDS